MLGSILHDLEAGGFWTMVQPLLVVMAGIWMSILLAGEVVRRLDWKWTPPRLPEVLWVLVPLGMAGYVSVAMGVTISDGLAHAASMAEAQDRQLEVSLTAGRFSASAVIGGLCLAMTAAMATVGLGVVSILRSKGKGKTDIIVSAISVGVALAGAAGLVVLNFILFSYGPRTSYVLIVAMGLIVAGVGCAMLAFRSRCEESSTGELSERLAGAMTAGLCLIGAGLMAFGYQLEDGMMAIERSASLEGYSQELASTVVEVWVELGILVVLGVVILGFVAALVVGRGVEAGWDRRATITTATCLFLTIPLVGAAGYTALQISELNQEYQQTVLKPGEGGED